MPKVSIAENDETLLRKHDVWLPWEGAGVGPIAQTDVSQSLA